MNHSEKNRHRTESVSRNSLPPPKYVSRTLPFFPLIIFLPLFPSNAGKKKDDNRPQQVQGEELRAGKMMIGVVEIWSAVKFLTHSPNYSPPDTFCF